MASSCNTARVEHYMSLEILSILWDSIYIRRSQASIVYRYTNVSLNLVFNISVAKLQSLRNVKIINILCYAMSN